MKRAIFISALILISIVSCNSLKNQASSVFPERTKSSSVVDVSKIFSTSENAKLTKKLLQYKNETTREILVVTIDSITPYNDILKYGNDLGNYWGIGQKDLDNGLLIILSKPIRKVGISTGLGTEKVLTDSICKQIIDSVIIPKFKKDYYYEGVDSGIDAIINSWK